VGQLVKKRGDGSGHVSTRHLNDAARHAEDQEQTANIDGFD